SPGQPTRLGCNEGYTPGGVLDRNVELCMNRGVISRSLRGLLDKIHTALASFWDVDGRKRLVPQPRRLCPEGRSHVWDNLGTKHCTKSGKTVLCNIETYYIYQ